MIALLSFPAQPQSEREINNIKITVQLFGKPIKTLYELVPTKYSEPSPPSHSDWSVCAEV